MLDLSSKKETYVKNRVIRVANNTHATRQWRARLSCNVVGALGELPERVQSNVQVKITHEQTLFLDSRLDSNS